LTTHFLNLNGFFRPALFDSTSLKPLTWSQLSRVLPPSLAALELSEDPFVPIPDGILESVRQYRPTPLLRARELEKKIGTSCRLYFKDEGSTPTGNHKINSAYLIADLCKRDGIGTITTETTGNWGLALAMAGAEYGLHVVCFIDSDSHSQRPDRKPAMERAGAEVRVVERDIKHHDLLTLSADAAIEATRTMQNAYYIFGSVYNYFIVAQSLIGIEAKDQMLQQGEYPDVVVGCCGGGANLLGIAGAFLVDRLTEGRVVDFYSAESSCCPVLTRGERGLYSIDESSYYPKVDTLGLPGGLLRTEYIGGLGSTLVAPPVAEMYRRKLLSAASYSSEQAMRSAKVFYETQGRWLALESSYTVAAVLDLARRYSDLRLLANISTCESDRALLDLEFPLALVS